MNARNCRLQLIEFNAAHLKATVFIGPEGQTLASSGTLVFDRDHWQADMQALAVALQQYVEQAKPLWEQLSDEDKQRLAEAAEKDHSDRP